MAAILVDTNVLVYAHDPGQPVKRSLAIRVLRHLHATGAGCLSAQVLAEFFATVIRGRAPLLASALAARQTERLARSWPVLDLTPMVVLEAIRGVRERKLSYGDAQLWATARLNQVPVLFSEDFATGAVLDGVRFVNPLVPDFSVEQWV